MRYPKDDQINDFFNELTDDDFSDDLPEDASPVDKTKYELCRKFVVYLREKKISQAQLARDLKIDRSRINWIVKYKINHFTIDKLYELWSTVDPTFQLKVL